MGNLFFKRSFYKIDDRVYEVAGLLESIDGVSNVCKKCGNEKISGTRMQIIDFIKGGMFFSQKEKMDFLEKINEIFSGSDWCERCCRFQFQL